MPLARPGRAGHDGKTSWYGKNHNDVCRELAQSAIDTKTCSFRNSIARCVPQAKHDPGAIFELRWSARIPLARPGRAGHDGKTSWHGSNHNVFADRLRSQQSTQKPALRNSIARCVQQVKHASWSHL
jgi:hypothetical protein